MEPFKDLIWPLNNNNVRSPIELTVFPDGPQTCMPSCLKYYRHTAIEQQPHVKEECFFMAVRVA